MATRPFMTMPLHKSWDSRALSSKGPTHFSQFAPLGFALWGNHWLEQGCISAHYRSPVYEGEEVRAFLRRPGAGAALAEIWMLRANGDEILRCSPIR